MGGRTSGTPIIEIKNVGKTFTRKGSTLEAIADISLQVQEKELIALLGPSGCGKTTLLNILAGFQSPTHGEILVEGELVEAPHHSRGIIFQEPLLFPWLSTWDNIMFGPRMRGLTGKEAIERAEHLLKFVGLREFKDFKPYELSGGMQHRAAVLRTLVNDPTIILADEPFAALDPYTRWNLQEEFVRIWQETGKTVVWVTHIMEEAIYLADRVVILTHRPAKIKKIIEIDLKRPRDRLSEGFLGYVKEIYSYVKPEL